MLGVYKIWNKKISFRFSKENTNLNYKDKLQKIYEEKADGVRIRSECEWYEFEEKSSNFFLNLEKKHAKC